MEVGGGSKVTRYHESVDDCSSLYEKHQLYKCFFFKNS